MGYSPLGHEESHMTELARSLMMEMENENCSPVTKRILIMPNKVSDLIS